MTGRSWSTTASKSANNPSNLPRSRMAGWGRSLRSVGGYPLGPLSLLGPVVMDRLCLYDLARYPSKSTDEAGAELQWAAGSAQRPQSKRGPCAIFVGEGRDRRVRVGDFLETAWNACQLKPCNRPARKFTGKDKTLLGVVEQADYIWFRS